MIMAGAEDPALLCYFDGCINVGQQLCYWKKNYCFCCHRQSGGCRRRLCSIHRGVVYTDTDTQRHDCTACTDCVHAIKKDMAADLRCKLLLFWMLCLLIFGTVPISVGLYTLITELTAFD